jgi:hypothetical protein
MKRAEEVFIALWCTVMPITSFVLIPSIPGTIPAYLLALVSVGFIAARMIMGEIDPRMFGYLKILFISILLWLLLVAGSQLGHIFSNRSGFGDAYMIAPDDPTVLFRSGLFTQSMYLFACILIAIYLRFFFQPHMMRYVYWGAYLMAIYGIYEWLLYFIFKMPGDFLENRVYGMDRADTHTGSWSQGIDFAGINLLRIKSTFGEPSFFSAAVVPYFFLALDNKKTVLTALLLFVAFFSTSTSCYISLAICFVVRTFTVGSPNLFTVLLFSVGLYAMASLFPDTFNQLFGEKFSGDNESGQAHQKGMQSLGDLLSTFSLFNWIFGIGLGYIYAGVTFAVFFNTGLLGFAIYIFMFCKPMILLGHKDLEALGLKTALFGILVAYTLNVSEFFLPTTWMFIGLAYWKLNQVKTVELVPA